MTVSAPDVTQAHEVAERLFRLGEEERVVVVEGRFEDLADIADRRAALIRELDAALIAEPLPPGELRDLIVGLHDQARETMTLLAALREEMAGSVEKAREERRAAVSYETSRDL